MTRTSLDDALWASLTLTTQRIPHAWKHDDAALRRFVEAALWICRTGAPWRDLPDELGYWPGVYHRFRRWSVRGWWELAFEALRPALPADGLVLLDSTTCKAHRAASGAACSNAEAECLGRSRGGICSKLRVCADGAGRSSCQALASTPTCVMPRPSCPASPRVTQPLTAATSQPGCAPRSLWTAAPSTPRPSSAWSIPRSGTKSSTPGAATSKTCSPS